MGGTTGAALGAGAGYLSSRFEKDPQKRKEKAINRSLLGAVIAGALGAGAGNMVAENALDKAVEVTGQNMGPDGTFSTAVNEELRSGGGLSALYKSLEILRDRNSLGARAQEHLRPSVEEGYKDLRLNPFGSPGKITQEFDNADMRTMRLLAKKIMGSN